MAKGKRGEAKMVVDAAVIPPCYTINRRGRFWEVLDATGDLVCMTVYKRGAKEVIRRVCA